MGVTNTQAAPPHLMLNVPQFLKPIPALHPFMIFPKLSGNIVGGWDSGDEKVTQENLSKKAEEPGVGGHPTPTSSAGVCPI